MVGLDDPGTPTNPSVRSGVCLPSLEGKFMKAAFFCSLASLSYPKFAKHIVSA